MDHSNDGDDFRLDPRRRRYRLPGCPGCGAVWYFRRRFCPRCGRRDRRSRQAAGTGTVHAVTLVGARAQRGDCAPYAPYAIALVDADEGFRLMAHGEPALRIGDRVRAVRYGGWTPFCPASRG